MNERLKELMKQSETECGFDANKFAELIVRECAKIVEDSTWNLPHGYKAVDQAKLVKKHFGVEE